jgi:PAS domain S-box-containing protein
LAARLLIGSGAAMMVSGALILYSVVLGEIESSREEFKREVEYQIEFLTPAITEQAIVGDYSTIQQMFTAHAQRPGVEQISWTDNKGNPIRAIGPKVKNEAPAWFTSWVDISLPAKSKSISVGGVDYGEFYLRLTPFPVINQIWAAFVDKVQMLVLGIGMFIAVTLTIVTNGLQPLYALAVGARRFGQGDHSVRVAPKGAPEMQETLNAFNSMAESIESLLKSLQESDSNNRRLAKIVEQSNEAIVTKDLNGIITTWNSGATRLYGYSAEEAIGKPAAFMAAPDVGEQDPWCGNQAMTADTVIAFEARRLTKSGYVVDIEMSIAPLVNEKNEPLGAIGIARDISERMEAQAALLAAKEAAEAASRAKSQFLANMSHEIRTPMNGVLGMTELLLNTELTEAQRRFAQTVHSSGEALLNVINDVLDFSKIEAGKLELERIDFDLREVVEDVSELLAGRAHMKDVEMICHVGDQVPSRLRGDPSRLRQVLTNLVGNAVKFTERGEIVVRAELLPIEPPSEGGEYLVKLTVTDTGPGIAPKVHERIFDAFSQADGSTTRKYGGTGLGLAIARQLVQMMGGEIGVTSELGKGSTFWFTARLEAALEQPTRESLKPRDLAGLRVLVVDDNETNREILLRQLNGWSMRVDLAASVPEALNLLRSGGEPYRLAILDMHMPEADGLQLAERIRQDPAHDALQLMILSSVGKDVPTETLQKMRISRWISKPIRQSQLLKALVRLVRSPGTAEPVLPLRSNQLAPLSGRILLAEDSAVNQQVAAAMLQDLGCGATIVSDGRETLAALARESFDLVLMDCHMPELDGFATAAAIREKERSTLKQGHLPIIALTADAMQGGRERCLAAGMDDYLTKPFNREQLHAMLKRWLPATKHTAANAVSPTPPQPAHVASEALSEPSQPSPDSRSDRPQTEQASSTHESPLVNDALDNIRALQTKNGADIVSKVVQLYVSSVPKLLKTMQDAIGNEDCRALEMAAHTLKSSSANVGAMKLAELCKEAERQAHAGEMTRADTRLVNILEEFERVQVALNTHLTSRTSA